MSNNWVRLEPFKSPIFEGMLPDSHMMAIECLFKFQGKISAIKYIRGVYAGSSLLSCKKAIENLIKNNEWKQTNYIVQYDE